MEKKIAQATPLSRRGNRVSVTDLCKSQTTTLPIQFSSNIPASPSPLAAPSFSPSTKIIAASSPSYHVQTPCRSGEIQGRHETHRCRRREACSDMEVACFP
jgi:hypothetical protein